MEEKALFTPEKIYKSSKKTITNIRENRGIRECGVIVTSANVVV
jgi:hypothetical protein